MTVAAGNRHPRLRNAKLRPDHVDDALEPAVEVEERHAILAAVAFERREHVLGHDVHERPPQIARRHDVIDRRDRPAGKPNLPAPRPQHVEGLRARDFMHQVQTHEELGLAVREYSDSMGVPDFLQERQRHFKVMVLRESALGVRRSALGARRSAVLALGLPHP